MANLIIISEELERICTLADYEPKKLRCDGIEFDSFDQQVECIIYLNAENSLRAESFTIPISTFENILNANGMEFWFNIEPEVDLNHEFYHYKASASERVAIHKACINLMLETLKVEVANG